MLGSNPGPQLRQVQEKGWCHLELEMFRQLVLTLGQVQLGRLHRGRRVALGQ